MKVADNWFGDLPQQFLGKTNWEVLINAFAEQLQEVADVFEDLQAGLDIDSAEGVNLDHIGDIICMSRSEAWVVLKSTQDAVITDEIYRKVLKWKLLRNTCECTYADVMKSVELIWDTDKIKYVENPDGAPARISLNMSEYDIDADDPTIGKGLPIKAAGVWLAYLINYLFTFDNTGLESIDNATLDIRTAMNFWGTQLLDGSLYLDGEAYYLDGSLYLDGDYNLAGGQSYLTTTGRYNLIFGFAESLGEFDTDNYLDNAALTVAAEQPVSEELSAGGGISLAYALDNFATEYLDGTQELDGSETLWTAHDYVLAVSVTGYSLDSATEEIDAVTIEYTSAEAAFLDGMYLLNGSTTLDKTNYTEEV